ncbi:hypothetical protein F4810DRAFT_279021 [Camillea tinctor]|nr:hypothetical protein F4810DRAFT_279021 [Camillea tinctor]
MYFLNTPTSITTGSPPITQVFVILHTYCLSSLVLHRSRREDNRQNQILTTSICACVGASFYIASENTWEDFGALVLLTLPLAISFALVISAMFHSVAVWLKGVQGDDDIPRNLGEKQDVFDDPRSGLRELYGCKSPCD